MNEFINKFANIFDDTNLDEFSPNTIFRDLEEWSSLHALATLNMIEIKYSVKLKAEEMKQANSIKELFDLVMSKK